FFFSSGRRHTRSTRDWSSDVCSSDLEGEHSYCSTQLATLGGAEQLLVATDVGLLSLDPARGTVLWQHRWPMEKGMARIVQPAVRSEERRVGQECGLGCAA